MKGSVNTQADWLSQQTIQEVEWSLHRSLFKFITSHFRCPIVDLFTSSQNNQLDRFFTRYFHPKVEATDALMLPWPQGLLYAFPPVPILHKVLRKIRDLKAEVLLVAPYWPRCPWFSALQEMAIAPPLTLPTSNNMLIQGPLFHPRPGWFHLTMWRLRGTNSYH